MAKEPVKKTAGKTAKKNIGTSKSLVIVESPAKARTINKYLGSKYVVKASIGHVKDLPSKELGINIEDNFTPQYEVIKGKGTFIKEIKKLGKDAKNIYLATDPDREGEVIAWHIANEITGTKSKPAQTSVFRVQFNEITPKAIKQAIEHPQSIDLNKVNAQQARRVLDRLVGYQISPLLWKNIKRGLSAGRVQSVAVRLVCEREAQIKQFVTKEYWSITADLEKQGAVFKAKLSKCNGEDIEVGSEEETENILNALAGHNFTVLSVEQKPKKKNPAAPFITSKLQQEASSKLGFAPRKTMMLAQQLYEGVELGSEGPVGLITYMRTDSTRVSTESIGMARNIIESSFGSSYLPNKPNFYKSKKNAQDAHEAIRPTYPDKAPDDIQAALTPDQYKLYKLIWLRFIASQMSQAVYDTMAVDITAGEYTFHATGSLLKFDGFLKVYAETPLDTKNPQKDTQINMLPSMQAGDNLTLTGLTPQQHFTQPPARYNEALLIKALEEEGIGRPSTYATIVSTIQSREYVELKEGRFRPSELGDLVNTRLVEHFPEILDIKFTAQMEKSLDAIEEGEKEWVGIVGNFYDGFKKTLDTATVEMKNVKAEEIPTDITCEKCGAIMAIKWGKNGKFLACKGYPDCKNTKEFAIDDEGNIKIVQTELPTDEKCEKCGSPMLIKAGRFGKFLACSGYPQCKTTKNITTGIKCPQPDCTGEICEKKTRRGKTFYSCSAYPKCKFAIWDKPVGKNCPNCNASFMVEKSSKNGETKLSCINEDCKKQPV